MDNKGVVNYKRTLAHWIALYKELLKMREKHRVTDFHVLLCEEHTEIAEGLDMVVEGFEHMFLELGLIHIIEHKEVV